jgi:transposase
VGKNVYLNEVKWAVVKDKMSGQFTNNEIMEKYGIKNVSQIKTWMKWYLENQVHRFDQPIGKQYYMVMDLTVQVMKRKKNVK